MGELLQWYETVQGIRVGKGFVRTGWLREGGFDLLFHPSLPIWNDLIIISRGFIINLNHEKKKERTKDNNSQSSLAFVVTSLH